MRAISIGVLLGLVLTLFAAAAIGLTVVYTGAYDVAATDRHADLVRWAFDTTMHRSVKRQARDVDEPPSIGSAAVEQGAQTYDSTCAHCHGAPGLERASWAANMRPMPPKLEEAATEWETREIFWIARHGIKMTGMPAFGPEHDDSTLWGVAAFVDQLPGMTPERYRTLTGGRSGNGRGHAQNDRGHEH